MARLFFVFLSFATGDKGRGVVRIHSPNHALNLTTNEYK